LQCTRSVTLCCVGVDGDDYDAARVGHYYTQRLVVSLLRAQAHLLRRKAVWESQARDMSLQARLVGKQLPLRGDVMVCLGLLMLSTYRYPP